MRGFAWIAGALLALGACDCSDDGDGTPADGGPMGFDAGPPVDGGPPVDTGPVPDTGPMPDTGPAPDTGPGVDAGPMMMGGCAGAEIRCGDACVDVSTSTAHCGGCDNACAMGEMCVAGDCGGSATCPPGTIDCGGECRDVSGDPEFCGSCGGGGCNDDEVCADGACVCRPGLTECAGNCVDTRSNREHCGMCGMGCGDMICVDGACAARMACTAPREICGGACVDTETSTDHCGGCGDGCAGDQVCIAGNCEDYEPALGCATCGGCMGCPMDADCCDLAGYGPSCLDTGVTCPSM